MRLRPGLGAEVPHRRGRLAQGLGPGHSLLCLPVGDPPGDLHDQRYRKRQRPAVQDHQDPGPFLPSDDASTKLIWLALRNITTDWGRAAKVWKEAMNQFAIHYGDRFTHPVHGVRSGVGFRRLGRGLGLNRIYLAPNF